MGKDNKVERRIEMG